MAHQEDRLGGLDGRNPEYWGYSASLYTSLRSESVKALESAVQSYVTGRFKEAKKRFEEAAPLASERVAWALEKSRFLDMIGQPISASACLRELLQDGHELSPPLLHLVKIRIASLELDAFGKGEAALQEARRLREWLIKQDFKNYTDIEVSCVLYDGVVFNRKSCNALSSTMKSSDLLDLLQTGLRVRSTVISQPQTNNPLFPASPRSGNTFNPRMNSGNANN
jgi:hypothetical protein